MKRNPIAGGALIFRTPYGGRARFDWWLDHYGHDVIVECTRPWRGLNTDIHRIGMAPKFTPAEARQIAEKLCRKIIDNLEFVIAHRNDEALQLESFYDNQQLPLYRGYAWEEEKRRFVSTALLAESFKDDDDNDDSPVNTMSAKHEQRADAELKSSPIELTKEIGPLTTAARRASSHQRVSCASIRSGLQPGMAS